MLPKCLLEVHSHLAPATIYTPLRVAGVEMLCTALSLATDRLPLLGCSMLVLGEPGLKPMVVPADN